MSLFGDELETDGKSEEMAKLNHEAAKVDFWNLDNFKRLQEQFNSGSMHHAILLLGPDGSGRELFAQEFSRWVLCQNRAENYCGQCKSCQLLESATHPDQYLLEIEEDKTQISVNQVRSLINSMQGSAHQNGWKLANISRVSALNQSSYNALLKTLEEPQQQTLIILQAQQLHGVPATIRSRSQLMSLSINDQEGVRDWLIERNGNLTEELALALQLFPQAPYKAEDFAKNGDAFKCNQFIVDFSELITNKISALAMAEKWQVDLSDCCLWMLLMMRDLMLLQQTHVRAEQAQQILLHSQLEALTSIVKSVNNQGLMQLNEKIVELQRLIKQKSPVNLSSSWQSLLIFVAQLARKNPV